MNFVKLQIRSVNLLNRKNKTLYVFGSALQASLGLIDLIGVLISGIIGVVASNVLTENQLPDLIVKILSFFELESKSPGSLIIILSVAALIFFLIKTFMGFGTKLVKKFFALLNFLLKVFSSW